jgi:hypothetical protein
MKEKDMLGWERKTMISQQKGRRKEKLQTQEKAQIPKVLIGICDNIRLHGGWQAPCELPRMRSSSALLLGCGVFIKTEKKRKKKIFTNIGDPLMAQIKHFFRKCPFMGPLKTSSPSKYCNL